MAKNIQKIKHKDINCLISAEYNPRQLKKEQYQNIKESLQRFGFVDPVIINKNKDRKNIIIGGHQRVKVAKDLKYTEVPCVELDLTLDKEKELNIRLNKNVGEWDYDILANLFDFNDLMDWGCDEKELQLGDLEFDYDVEKEKKEIPKELNNSVWREWAGEVKNQFAILKSFSGITPAYAKIMFLQSKYYAKEYPRHCSLAFHNHQFLTNGDLYSIYEGLDRVANNQIKAERLIFVTGENPKMNNITGGSLAFSGARLPLDFPANLSENIINKYAYGGKVLDPCFGWGGRLVGFLLSNAKYYYGIDVSPDQYKGVSKIKDSLLPLCDDKKEVNLECIPFEDNNLKEKFNLAITSPPYFDVEKYIGGEQSHKRYDNYEVWKEKFYIPLITKVYDLLYNGGVFALQVGSQRYPLLEDGKEIGESVGFVVGDDFSAGMDNNFNQTEDQKKERILILRKVDG